jgi:hypothetical protein
VQREKERRREKEREEEEEIEERERERGGGRDMEGLTEGQVEDEGVGENAPSSGIIGECVEQVGERVVAVETKIKAYTCYRARLICRFVRLLSLHF